jgi:uncharacterized protein YifN (PemK superfamily)
MAGIHPEMTKQRRVVVISPRSYNHRAAMNLPGRCIVVPFSATEPRDKRASHVPFKANSYRCLTENVWAICDCLTHVSHRRLERVAIGGRHIEERITEKDMERIEEPVSTP